MTGLEQTSDTPKRTEDEAMPQGTPPRQLFALKALVIGMAILMALLMLTIIGRVIYLVAKPSAGPPAEQSVGLTLPTGAQILSTSVDRDRVAIRYRVDERTFIEVRAADSGALVRRFEVTTGGPLPAPVD